MTFEKFASLASHYDSHNRAGFPIIFTYASTRAAHLSVTPKTPLHFACSLFLPSMVENSSYALFHVYPQHYEAVIALLREHVGAPNG